MLLEPGAGHAVGVQGGVEVRHHVALEVEGAAHLPVLDALHGGGDAPEDAVLAAAQAVLPALEIGQLQAEGAHQVVVQQAAGGRLQAGGHQHGKGSTLTCENVLVIHAIIVFCC